MCFVFALNVWCEKCVMANSEEKFTDMCLRCVGKK